MEIVFDNKKVTSFCEVCHQTRRIQESVESVVPDTLDDIGRIVSVRTELLLKSKDVRPGGVTVTGAAEATIVYITENEGKISFLNVTKDYTLEYDTADGDGELVAQINLSLTNSEARVLNPRKVSLVLEICGDMSCYREESTGVECSLPENCPVPLHALYEPGEIMLNSAVCEKTFVLNEQFPLPADRGEPESIVSRHAELCVGDVQMIGSKMILKGSAEIELYYMAAGKDHPLMARFSSPFSQIIDTGRENMESCTAFMTQTSVYCELIDTINGEKALELELHGVTQAVSRCRCAVNNISDAYSNLVKTECRTEAKQYGVVTESRTIRLEADERFGISEDCDDILCVFSSVLQTAVQPGGMTATVGFDVLYRNKNGELASVHRLTELQGDHPGTGRILTSRLAEVKIRPDGDAMDVRAGVEIGYIVAGSVEMSAVSAVIVDEESPLDPGEHPAVTLVRVENESLWELAKKYHSSVEKISSLNDTAELRGKLLLIPRTV